MTTLKFKTTLKCDGCKAKVSPFLNNETSIAQWNIDLINPDKILTVEGENVEAVTVQQILSKAGFKGELI